MPPAQTYGELAVGSSCLRAMIIFVSWLRDSRAVDGRTMLSGRWAASESCTSCPILRQLYCARRRATSVGWSRLPRRITARASQAGPPPSRSEGRHVALRPRRTLPRRAWTVNTRIDEVRSLYHLTASRAW